MKQLIKTILPQPALGAVREMRDRGRLCAVPGCAFDACNLRAENALPSLPEIFSDPHIAKTWEKDHADIAAVFSDKSGFGGVNPGDRRALYCLVSHLKPKKMLEVGTHVGASTLYIARALTQGTVTSVDILDVNDPDSGPWKKFGLPGSPRDNARKLGCLDRITFRVSPSVDFMKKDADRYDLIFLDGDHSAQAVYREMAVALPLLNEGGIILLHDFYPGGKALFPDGNRITGPYLAFERIMREHPDIRVRPLGNLPWPTKQGSHATSLALVHRTG